MQQSPRTDPSHSPQDTEPTAPAPARGLKLLYAGLGLVMLTGVTLNLANIIGRYAVGTPIFWAEEALVGITIWGVFFGAAVVSWRGDHLTMDLFYARLEGGWRVLVNSLIAATMVSVCAFVAWQSWTIVQMFYETEAVSAGAQIPKVIPHAALLVGFLLSALAVVVRWRLWVFGRHGSNG